MRTWVEECDSQRVLFKILIFDKSYVSDDRGNLPVIPSSDKGGDCETKMSADGWGCLHKRGIIGRDECSELFEGASREDWLVAPAKWLLIPDMAISGGLHKGLQFVGVKFYTWSALAQLCTGGDLE